MKSFKEFYYDKMEEEKLQKFLAEWNCFKLIPKTRNSFVEHPADTATLTQLHSHVYARPSGGGKIIYAVNLDGSGHDGSSGIKISNKHAEYFRGLGYLIPSNNILEMKAIKNISSKDWEILISFTDEQECQLLLG